MLIETLNETLPGAKWTSRARQTPGGAPLPPPLIDRSVLFRALRPKRVPSLIHPALPKAQISGLKASGLSFPASIRQKKAFS